MASSAVGLLPAIVVLLDIFPVPRSQDRLLTKGSHNNLEHSFVTLALNLSTVLSSPIGELPIIPPAKPLAVFPILTKILPAAALASATSPSTASVKAAEFGPNVMLIEPGT